MTRPVLILTALATVLLGLCLFAGAEAALVLLVGWVVFLLRVLPLVEVDRGGLAVGLAAAALFVLGAHRVARSAWRRLGGGEAGRWRLRWSVAGAGAVLLLFAAGTALVGLIHQAAWLLTSDEPLLARGLKKGGSSADNLRGLARAAHSYYDDSRHLPPGGTFAADGTMLHGWATHLLPFLGPGYSAGGIDWRRPWDHPANEGLFRCVLPELINPELRGAPLEDGRGFGLSHYAANVHVLGGGPARRLSGLGEPGHTILFGEVSAGFRPWGHPVNWRDPAVGISHPDGFGGPRHAGGAQFVMGDGSVRFVGERVSPEVLRALAVPGGRKDGGP